LLVFLIYHKAASVGKFSIWKFYLIPFSYLIGEMQLVEGGGSRGPHFHTFEEWQTNKQTIIPLLFIATKFLTTIILLQPLTINNYVGLSL